MEHLTLDLFLISLLGASSQEVLHWYNLRLDLESHKELLNSKLYIIITIISILFFGLTTIFIVDFLKLDMNVSSNSKIFISAMFYPIIIKKILQTVTKSLNVKKEITQKEIHYKINLKTYLTNF